MPYKDKEQQKEYQRLWIANRRAEYMVDKFCAICNSTINLEIDHIDPSTKSPLLKGFNANGNHRGTSNIWSWSLERRNKELEKCQVLCEVHHKEKTLKELTLPIIHGTEVGYSSKDCRCRLCKDAHSSYQRKYRTSLKK